MLKSPEINQNKQSPEYECGFNDALTFPIVEVEKARDSYANRVVERSERLQQKQEALETETDERNRMILEAEIAQTKMAIIHDQDFVRGYNDGLAQRRQGEKSEENREQAERKFKRIELTVVDPAMDKNFGITYDCPDKAFCVLYNMAIKDILDKEKMRPFLQSGGWNESGWHMWEVWRDTDHSQMEGFLEQIQREAEALFEERKNSTYFWEEED